MILKYTKSYILCLPKEPLHRLHVATISCILNLRLYIKPRWAPSTGAHSKLYCQDTRQKDHVFQAEAATPWRTGGSNISYLQPVVRWYKTDDDDADAEAEAEADDDDDDYDDDDDDDGDGDDDDDDDDDAVGVVVVVVGDQRWSWFNPPHVKEGKVGYKILIDRAVIPYMFGIRCVFRIMYIHYMEINI